MKLEKVINYEFNKTEIENSIGELQSKIYKTDYDYKTLRNLKSELEEIHILKHLNNRTDIVSIEYMKDLTSERVDRKLSRDEYKQNKLNQVGIDLIVETEKDWIEIDMKVLNYREKSQGRIYNGKANILYGVDSLVFQIMGKRDKGWANDRYKQTKVLMIYIPQVKCLYEINYRKLCDWLNSKINNKEIDKSRCIIYSKGRGINRYQEIVVSVPIDEIPRGVLVEIHKIN